MLQRVEYLSGFETSRVDGRQITKPIFSLMDTDTLTHRPGKSLLCRLSTYKNAAVYADIPKHLRLPIRDKYFLIKFGDRTVEEEEVSEDQVEADGPTDRAARRLARTTSLGRSSRRIMETLLEIEGRSESYYQYTSTMFIKQPKDMIQEGAEIRSGQAPPPPSRTTTRARPARSGRRRTGVATPRGGGTGGTGGGGY